MTFSVFYDHANLEHLDEVAKTWASCPECNKYFPDMTKMRMHLAKHANSGLISHFIRKNRWLILNTFSTSSQQTRLVSYIDSEIALLSLNNFRYNRNESNQIGFIFFQSITNRKLRRPRFLVTFARKAFTNTGRALLTPMKLIWIRFLFTFTSKKLDRLK